MDDNSNPAEPSRPLSGEVAVEMLGGALFSLSDALRASGFLENDDHHRRYEAVVATFQALRAQPQPAAGELEEVIKRCETRADDLGLEAELLRVELASHEAVKEQKWQEYEDTKSNEALARWRSFYDRLELCKRNLRLTDADVEHYRNCAAALRRSPSREDVIADLQRAGAAFVNWFDNCTDDAERRERPTALENALRIFRATPPSALKPEGGR